jgi:hypothetical protein
MKVTGRPVITHKPDNVVIFTEFPAVCAAEAEAYKSTGDMTIKVDGNEIILQNAPADVINEIDG